MSLLDKLSGIDLISFPTVSPDSNLDMINYIEKELDKKAEIDFKDMQPGDVEKTFANISNAKKKLNFEPKTNIKEGVPKFIQWYKSYYKIP